MKGVILDRTLATQDILSAVQERGLEYIVMLEKNSPGYACMMERHGRELRKLLLHGIDANGIISGMVDRASLFPQGADESHVALFYSAQRHAMDESAILRPAIDAMVEAEKNIALGRKVSLPKQVRDFMTMKFDAAGKVVCVEPEQEKFDAKFKGSGYFAIASSASRTARQILDIHALKVPRKYRFSSLESLAENLAGFDSERAFDGKSMKARMIPGFAGFAGFVAAVLGNGFKNECRESGLAPNRMLDALDEEVTLARMPNGDFLAGGSLSSSVGILLGNLGIRPDQLKQLALDLGVEERTPATDETRRLPLVEERRRRGRIKGSKNKKTLEREAREAELREQGLLPPKRRPGRPKSAKTLEREAREAELRERGELPERRGPGRPRGSRNRAALEREAQPKAGGEQAERRGPGRPKGGKNKTTLEREARMARAARKNAQKRQKEAESVLGTTSDRPSDTPAGTPSDNA